MKTKIVFVERKPSEAVSIEKVFRQVAKNLPKDKFSIFFQQLKYSNDTFGTIKNLIFFKRIKADIFHITGHIHYIAFLLPKNKTILTIHDAGILHIRSGLRRFILKKLLFDLPIKRLKYITVVSESTKNEILTFTNCEESKIRVIENPIQEHFRPSQKKKFNEQCPAILHIGTTENKNLPNLIKAIEEISCQLTIIGNLNASIKNLLNESNVKYKNKVNLSNEEIRDEYANADLVTFCSTFEGFGLPIIEAQAMHTPIVTSAISPLKEVAGDGAGFADPYSIESIRREILRVIKNPDYRRNLVSKGIENVKKFQPEKIALLYQDIYQDILTTNI